MDEAVVAHDLLGGLRSHGGENGLVHGGGYQVVEDDLGLGPVGSGGLGGHTGDGIPEIVGELGLIVSGGALQGAVLGNNVPAAAGLQLAHSEDSCISRIYFPADNSLEILDNGAGDHNGVDALLGCGAMAASAVDIDGEHVGSGHAGACLNRDLTRFHIGPDMDTETSVHAVHSAVLNHGHGALGNLLGGLEGQLYGAAELVLMVVEQAGHGEHGGSMAVMAAGVHHTGVLAGILYAGLLLNGEGVHIAAQEYGLAGLCALNGGQHTGLHAAGAPLDAVLVQLRLDCLAGLILLAADFRMCVEVTAHLYQVIVVGSCYLFDIHYVVS